MVLVEGNKQQNNPKKKGTIYDERYGGENGVED